MRKTNSKISLKKLNTNALSSSDLLGSGMSSKRSDTLQKVDQLASTVPIKISKKLKLRSLSLKSIENAIKERERESEIS